MNFEAVDRRTVQARISVNGSGDILFRAENWRYERTGPHAKVSISHNGVCLDYDVFNVDRSADRHRIVSSAHKLLPAKAKNTYPAEIMKADMDRFCLALEGQWQNRIPCQTISAGLSEEPPKPPPYLLYPLLVKDNPNALFGERSAAKSLTAAVLASIVLLPWKDNPIKTVVCEESVNTLWCDWEWGFSDITYNLERIVRGHKLNLLELHHQPMIGPLSRNIGLVQRLRAEHNADLIIYDSLTMASGAANLNETQAPIELYDSIHEIGGTSLLLGHTSKVEAERKTMYGNQAYESQARNVWECLKAEPDEHSIYVGMFHRKSPPSTHRSKPIGFHANFDEEEGSIVLSWADPKKIEEFSSKLNVRDRVLLALRTGGQQSPTDLASDLGLKRNTINQTLGRLEDQGEVVKTFSGAWKLADGADTIVKSGDRK